MRLHPRTIAQRRARLAGGAAAAFACLAASLLPSQGATEPTAGFTADGRAPLGQLEARYRSLATDQHWREDEIYAYGDGGSLVIRTWRSVQRGEALWILAGIHGEEPAGPNAIAESLANIRELAAAGVPVVLIPMCNPKAYRSNWRYPNTAERDWRKGGYSVGDAEYLLPDLETGQGPRAAAPPGPETLALTQYVLRTARDYPPRLVIDLHEDELSTEGGYLYSQGERAEDGRVAAEVIRQLRSAGMPLRLTGRTRFDEPIVDGVIRVDDAGRPIRDGSIDELLAAPEVIADGRLVPGLAAPHVIVVETPAFAGSRLEFRVAAQRAVLGGLGELWRLAGEVAGP
jgi:hypothetical protein